MQEESYFHYRFDDTIGGAEDGGYWETDTSIKVSDSLFIGTLEVNNTDKEVSRFLGVETDPTSHLSTGVRDGDWYYVKNVAYASSPSIADGLYMRADSTWIKVS